MGIFENPSLLSFFFVNLFFKKLLGENLDSHIITLASRLVKIVGMKGKIKKGKKSIYDYFNKKQF